MAGDGVDGGVFVHQRGREAQSRPGFQVPHQGNGVPGGDAEAFQGFGRIDLIGRNAQEFGNLLNKPVTYVVKRRWEHGFSKQ